MPRRWRVLFYYLDPVVKPQDDIKKKKSQDESLKIFFICVALRVVRYINIKKLAIVKLLFYH